MSPPRRFQGSSAAKEAAQPGPSRPGLPKAPSRAPNPISPRVAPGNIALHRAVRRIAAGLWNKRAARKGSGVARPSERRGSAEPTGPPGFVRAQGREGLRDPAIHGRALRSEVVVVALAPLAPPSSPFGVPIHSWGVGGAQTAGLRLTLLLTSTALQS